jgi:Zn-dependent M28 family amino/carboxypeptidase
MTTKGFLVTSLATWVGLTLVFLTATAHNGSPPPAEVGIALESISGADLLRHINVLASDAFEGRSPGTKGEDLTVDYLTAQFKRLGAKPGNPDGTYVQKVVLTGYTSQTAASFEVGSKRIDLKLPEDMAAGSSRFVPEVTVRNSEVVFVGYGVVAPEYGWDDYKGVDVRGKTLLMLINDPAVSDPENPSTLDERMFKGRAMTYYGRWTYKYEIASEKGAAAAIIVHETGPAGYPYEVAAGRYGRENMDVRRADKNMSRVQVEGWIHLERAKELFAAGGHDFDALKQAAAVKDFKPVALGATANFTVKNVIREMQSRNVVAKLEGSDPKLKSEYVAYTAHWDHLGRDEKRQGDQIYNGAVDNASGTAALLELAEAYTKLKKPPKRSILFLAVTVEEKGLLGSKYYAANPLYPLERTLAIVNMDGLNPWGRTKDIGIVGMGNSTLDDVLTEAATARGRVVTPEAEPEKGYFYRSDHFVFAKEGVPALYTNIGTDFVGKAGGYGKKKMDEYTERDYHKVSDEVKQDWDMAGAVDDVQLFFEVGYRVAQGPSYPEWKPGTEFKAKRDEMLKRSGQ